MINITDICLGALILLLIYFVMLLENPVRGAIHTGDNMSYMERK